MKKLQYVKKQLYYDKETFENNIAQGNIVSALKAIEMMLFRLDLENNPNDYNGVRALIDQTKPLINSDNDVQIEALRSTEDRLSKLIAFRNNKSSLQIKGCEDPLITQDNIIRCAIDTDYDDISIVNQLVNQIWNNPYTNKLFSFVATAIVDPQNNFKFWISPTLGFLQKFNNHLEMDADFSHLLHETYHVLQGILFNGHDYLNVDSLDGTGGSKEKFYLYLEQTYINVIRFLDSNFIASGNETIHDFIKLLREEIVDTAENCDALMHHSDKVLAAMKAQLSISEFIELLSKQSIPDANDIKTFEEGIAQLVVQLCDPVSIKYGIKKENFPFKMFKSIEYAQSKGERMGSTWTHYPEYKKHGYSDEFMPVFFESLVDEVITPEITCLFEPMLRYFNESVVGLGRLLEKQHIRDCPYVNDTHCIKPEFSFGIAPIQCIQELVGNDYGSEEETEFIFLS